MAYQTDAVVRRIEMGMSHCGETGATFAAFGTGPQLRAIARGFGRKVRAGALWVSSVRTDAAIRIAPFQITILLSMHRLPESAIRGTEDRRITRQTK